MKYKPWVLILAFQLFFACTADDEQTLIKDNVLSEESLRNWNNATIAALDSSLLFCEGDQKLEVEYLKNSLGKMSEGDTVLLREDFVNLIRRSELIEDTIKYDSSYIIEHHLFGEEIWIEKYLVINQNDSTTYYYTRYINGEWEQLLKKKVVLINLNRFLDGVDPCDLNSQGSRRSGFIILTKIAGDVFLSNFYSNLSKGNYANFEKLFSPIIAD